MAELRFVNLGGYVRAEATCPVCGIIMTGAATGLWGTTDDNVQRALLVAEENLADIWNNAWSCHDPGGHCPLWAIPVETRRVMTGP